MPTKIPTLLGFLLVVIIVGVVAVGSDKIFQTATKASGSIAPEKIRVVNITDTAFTVTWETGTPATGAISVDNRVIFDDRDTKTQEKNTAHIATARNLTPGSEYSFRVLSNGKKNEPVRTRTAPAITVQGGNLEPAYGTVVSADKSPVRGALVFVTLDGSQTLATVTKQSGTWLIPLNLIRTQDLTGYLPVTDRMNIAITVQSQGLTTTAVTDTLNASPVPDMMLGKTYDFRRANAAVPNAKQLAVLPSPTPPTNGGAVLGAATAKPANTVSLIVPAQGAALPTTLPFIQGTGIPGKTVSIVLGITNPIGGTAIVGGDGLWNFTPPKPLAAGAQSITITTQDKNNKPVAITNNFTILKSGTQVLGDATPSASLTPTAAPTVIPTATVSATPTPTATLSAQEVPVSGNTLPTIILLLVGAGLLVGGGVLTFDARTN